MKQAYIDAIGQVVLRQLDAIDLLNYPVISHLVEVQAIQNQRIDERVYHYVIFIQGLVLHCISLPLHFISLPLHFISLPFNRRSLPFNRRSLPFNRRRLLHRRLILVFDWLATDDGCHCIEPDIGVWKQPLEHQMQLIDGSLILRVEGQLLIGAAMDDNLIDYGLRVDGGWLIVGPTANLVVGPSANLVVIPTANLVVGPSANPAGNGHTRQGGFHSGFKMLINQYSYMNVSLYQFLDLLQNFDFLLLLLLMGCVD